jgi:uncharacterized membrane protein
MLCSIAAICLDVVGFGVMGTIMLVCMLGINLGCYVDDIMDQNKDLKNDLNAANKKLDQLEKLIKHLEDSIYDSKRID